MSDDLIERLRLRTRQSVRSNYSANDKALDEAAADEIERHRARIAALEAALNITADYLDKLHDNIMANDADMLMDICESPNAFADRARAALAKGETK